jgi:hypothetical protein
VAELLARAAAGFQALKRHDITLNRFGIPKSVGF